MLTAVKASLTYFTIVFAFGFLLGALRVFFLAALVGETLAVFLELPVMVLISWIICRWTISLHAVPARFLPRVAMGSVAFTLLMSAEISLAAAIADQTRDQYLSGFQTVSGAAGLLAQGLFALFPTLQVINDRIDETSSTR